MSIPNSSTSSSAAQSPRTLKLCKSHKKTRKDKKRRIQEIDQGGNAGSPPPKKLKFTMNKKSVKKTWIELDENEIGAHYEEDLFILQFSPCKRFKGVMIWVSTIECQIFKLILPRSHSVASTLHRHLKVGAWHTISGGVKCNDNGEKNLMITSVMQSKRISRAVRRPEIYQEGEEEADDDDDLGATTNNYEQQPTITATNNSNTPPGVCNGDETGADFEQTDDGVELEEAGSDRGHTDDGIESEEAGSDRGHTDDGVESGEAGSDLGDSDDPKGKEEESKSDETANNSVDDGAKSNETGNNSVDGGKGGDAGKGDGSGSDDEDTKWEERPPPNFMQLLRDLTFCGLDLRKLPYIMQQFQNTIRVKLLMHIS